MTKEKGKKSLIMMILYKNIFIGFTKLVTLAEYIKIVTEEKKSKIVITRT